MKIEVVTENGTTTEIVTTVIHIKEIEEMVREETTDEMIGVIIYLLNNGIIFKKEIHVEEMIGEKRSVDPSYKW